MYVVIFCLGVALIVLEVLASKNNKRIAATSLPGSRRLLMYRWRYLMGAPLAVASAFVSYPLSSGEDHYQIAESFGVTRHRRKYADVGESVTGAG